MLDLKMIVNSMVNQLCTLANEITRVSLEVGTEGILGGQATVPDVQGIWKVRTDDRVLLSCEQNADWFIDVDVQRKFDGDEPDRPSAFDRRCN